MSEIKVKEESAESPEHLPDDPAVSFDPKKTYLFGALQLDSRRTDATVSAPVEEPDSADRFASLAQLAEGGGFILEHVIAKGGFGEIWQSRQLSLSRMIAVKRLRPDIQAQVRSDESAWRHVQTLFQQEALTTANLEHPNIVPIYDLGRDEDGHPLLAMKLVRGQPWSELIEVDAPMEVDDFLARHLPILINVAQAVAYAHSRGILHRDIKPAQVLVGEFGEVLLTDWGLAVVYNEDKIQPEHLREAFTRCYMNLTKASSPSGTVAFMAPEQTHRHADEIGPWTDIYLLGSTLYYLLTLTFPHNAPDVKAAFAQAKSGFVEPPEKRAPTRDIPPEISRLCQWAMAANPRDRIPSAVEFIAELKDFVSGSGHRRQSRQLTREVAGHHWRGERSYELLGEWESQLTQALNLWPANREARSLRQNVLREYCNAALENGDLKLAHVQARRLESVEEREQYLGQIDEREKNKESHRLQRRFYITCTVLLLVLVSFLALLSNYRRVEAERARNAAEVNLNSAQRALDAAQANRARADAALKKAEEAMILLLETQTTPLAPAEAEAQVREMMAE